MKMIITDEVWDEINRNDEKIRQKKLFLNRNCFDGGFQKKFPVEKSPCLKKIKALIKLQYNIKFKVKKMNSLNRRLDARNKIMMGGLIIKAGLDDLHKTNKAALLGILLDAKQKLKNADKLERKKLMQNYTYIGAKAFGGNVETTS